MRCASEERVPEAEFAYDARGNWTRGTFPVRPAGAGRPEPYRAEFRETAFLTLRRFVRGEARLPALKDNRLSKITGRG